MAHPVLGLVPELPIVSHESEEKVKEDIPDIMALKVGILHLLHLEKVGTFRIFQELSDFLRIVDLELLQLLHQLLQ